MGFGVVLRFVYSPELYLEEELREDIADFPNYLVALKTRCLRINSRCFSMLIDVVLVRFEKSEWGFQKQTQSPKILTNLDIIDFVFLLPLPNCWFFRLVGYVHLRNNT